MGNLSKSSQAFIEQNNATEFSCSEPWLEKLRKSGLENFSINTGVALGGVVRYMGYGRLAAIP